MTGKKHHGYSGHMGKGQSRHGGKGRHGKHNVLKYREELGLTEEQVDKIKSLKIENKKRTIRLRADIDVAEIELRELLHKEKVDMGEVGRKVGEIEAKSAEVRIDKYQTRVDVKSLLTPEQIKKWKKTFRKAMNQ